MRIVMLDGRRQGREKAEAWRKIAEEEIRPCLIRRVWSVRERVRIAAVSSVAVGRGWGILSIEE